MTSGRVSIGVSATARRGYSVASLIADTARLRRDDQLGQTRDQLLDVRGDEPDRFDEPGHVGACERDRPSRRWEIGEEPLSRTERTAAVVVEHEVVHDDVPTVCCGRPGPFHQLCVVPSGYRAHQVRHEYQVLMGRPHGLECVARDEVNAIGQSRFGREDPSHVDNSGKVEDRGSQATVE
jgi:hypothetical protein